MIETLSAIILKKGSAYLAKSFATDVIERWTRYRANNFVEAFICAVGDGKDEEEIALLLDEILHSEKKSEILFEAYRSISLSKSKDIGPRAIGLLTAQIISEDRVATGWEEFWFQAYETLSDMELIATEDFYTHAFSKMRDAEAKDYQMKGNDLQIEWAADATDFKGTTDRSQLDLYTCLGPWAGKLGVLGLMHTRITEEVWDYREDGKYIGEPETARNITYWIDLSLHDEEYAALIGKAHRMAPT